MTREINEAEKSDKRPYKHSSDHLLGRGICGSPPDTEPPTPTRQRYREFRNDGPYVSPRDLEFLDRLERRATQQKATNVAKEGADA